MSVSITKPAIGQVSGWGQSLNTALDAIVAEVNSFESTVSATYAPLLPTAGSYTYNGDGTVASDPDGNSYTYNGDGTVHTITKSGVTRTYSYNSDGSVAGVS